MAEVVAPGGRLVVVGHSPSDAEAGVRRPPAEMMFEAAELQGFFASRATTLRVETWQREQQGPDGESVMVADVVAIIEF